MSPVPAGGRRRPPAEHVRRTVLPSGLRILTDTQPASASAAISVWVGVGSRDEPDATAGTSHFLEHLLFKGTAERDARSIARQIDAVGGEMNAFTASEHTAFYAHVPADALAMATEVLLDVVERPALAAAEVDSEREVILEELAAADDDPDDVVAVRLFESLFPDHPLGRETLGTPVSIAGLGREDISEFFHRWYQPANLVVAAAGDVEHDQLVELVAARFEGRPPGVAPRRAAPAATVVDRIELRRPVEQAHLALGWRSPSINDDARFPLALLNHVFGGGPSSRLFQEIRESRGLTYAVGSEVSHYTDSGALSVHCTTTPQKVLQMMELLDAIVGDDVERAKGALRGGLVMTYESTVARMSRLGAAETLRGEVTPIAEHLDRLDAVSPEDVRRVAHQVFGGRRSLAIVAPEDVDLGV
jgi:predicted Zn-dependent peptidase